MRRSNEPLFWALFGAGGMLSALVGPALVLATGILVPLGWLLPQDTMRYERMLAFLQHPVGGACVVAVVSLFLFHGCHRMRHSLHDLGIRTGPWSSRMFYGFASAGSVAAAVLLFRLAR